MKQPNGINLLSKFKQRYSKVTIVCHVLIKMKYFTTSDKMEIVRLIGDNVRSTREPAA